MSLITDLPAIFDQFSEARQKGFLTVMDLKEQGIPLVGTYCTFMPQEIPMAAGAVVVSLCSTSDETIEEAEKDLPRNLCPLIKSSYGFGKTDKCPYFYFSDLVVGETTCDGKKKMYEYMAEFKAVHVMQLPNSSQDAPHARCGKQKFCVCNRLWKHALGRRLPKRHCVTPLSSKTVSVVHWRISIVSGSLIPLH
ncbi:2-hydroxyglutaryl-CoA dehydratase, D-component [Citrobacter amalonaticus]|nr:2-hydroxyglutaryl-CoA dehydratase, D-component [Citrobacter amalonaticus]